MLRGSPTPVVMRLLSCVAPSLVHLLGSSSVLAQDRAAFDILGLGAVRVQFERPAGELRFYLNESAASFFSIRAEAGAIPPSIDVLDLNGDGYKDVVFYRMKSGYGGSPTRGGDVLIYAPKLKTFVRSEALSERGEITVGQRKGCADVLYKSGPSGYTREQWCFNQQRGRWRMVSREVDAE